MVATDDVDDCRFCPQRATNPARHPHRTMSVTTTNPARTDAHPTKVGQPVGQPGAAAVAVAALTGLACGCGCRKPHLCRSSSIRILVEDTSVPVAPADVEVLESGEVGDRAWSPA
jgi:hypothetical protein